MRASAVVRVPLVGWVDERNPTNHYISLVSSISLTQFMLATDLAIRVIIISGSVFVDSIAMLGSIGLGLYRSLEDSIANSDLTNLLNLPN
jgi:hypothetical protein